MSQLLQFFLFIVFPSLALLSGIGLSGYEIYRIQEYRLLVLILLLGVMLQHQVLEWMAFWTTGQVTEPATGEIFETGANTIASGGVYWLLVLLRRERSLQDYRDRTKQEYQSMVQSAPTPIIYHCPDQIRLANEAMVSMIGLQSADELVGRHLSSFVVPEDRRLIENTIKERQQINDNELVRFKTADGNHRTAVLATEPISVHGRDGLQITLNDITEREQSRAELQQTKDSLQTLFNNIQDGLLVIDIDEERILDANQRACEMLGYSKDELTNLRPQDIHPNELEKLQEFFRSVIDGERKTTENLHCRRKDGGRINAAISAGVTQIDDSRQVVVSIRDISERNQRERQIEFLYRLFRHNVRNRMNVIIGHVSWLKTQISGDAAERVETVESTSKRFVEMSEQIREVTATLQRGVALETEQTDFSQLVIEIVEKYRNCEGVSIETAIKGNVTTKGNDSIRLAIDNLLENAVVHAGDRPNIQVSLEQTSVAGTRMAQLKIEDDGPGIPEDEQVVIEVDKQSQLNHGSGLGLQVVAQIVDTYGGEFNIYNREADSKSEKTGTCVAITTPLASTTEMQKSSPELSRINEV